MKDSGPSWREQNPELGKIPPQERPPSARQKSIPASGEVPVNPLDSVIGRATVDPEYRNLLLRRPYVAYVDNPHLTDPRLKEAIGAIEADDLAAFARLGLLAQQIVRANPRLPFPEIRQRMKEASQRIKEERQNPHPPSGK